MGKIIWHISLYKPPDISISEDTHGLVALEALLVQDKVNPPKWMTFSKVESEVLAISVALLNVTMKNRQLPSFSSESDTSKRSAPMFGDPQIDNAFSKVFKGLHQFMSGMQEKDVHRSLVTGSLSFVNVWDIGVNRGTYEVVSMLARNCKNLILLNTFSLAHDVDSLHRVPDLSDARYDRRYEGRKDDKTVMTLQTKFEYLFYPVCVCKGKKESTLLVGTHPANALLEDEVKQRSEKVLQRVQLEAEIRNCSDSLMPFIVPVQSQSKRDIEKLQRAVEDMIGKDNRYEVELPLSWGFLRYFLSYTQKMYIPMTELIETAKKCHIFDRKDLDDFISLFSSTGSIIHISELCPECGDEYVILRPAEFVKEVDKLYYLEMVEGIEDSEEIQKLKEKHKQGYVSKKLAEVLWAEAPGTDCIHSFYIHALRRLGIIAALKGKKESKKLEEKETELQKYFMPTARPKPNIENPAPTSLFLLHDVVFPFPLQSEFLMYFQETLQTVLEFQPTDCFNTLHFKCLTDDIPQENFHLTIRFSLGGFTEICADRPSIKLCSVIKTACIEVMNGIQHKRPELSLDYDLAVMCPSVGKSAKKQHFVTFHPLEYENELYCDECHTMVGLGEGQSGSVGGGEVGEGSGGVGTGLTWIQAVYTGPRSLVQSPDGKLSVLFC